MRRSVLALMLVLAAACFRGDEPMAGGKPLSHWKKEATKVSFFSFLNSEKDERRRVAFRRLSEIGERAVPALVDLLKHRNISVSSDAFNALANLGPRAERAVPAMEQMLHSEKSTDRSTGAWILGTIGPAAERAVPSLTRLLSDPNEKVRQVAAQALGQIGGEGRSALERARTSDDPVLREGGVGGASGSDMTPDERRRHVASGSSDVEPKVRLRALDLLMTAPRAEVEPLAPYLVRALNDANAEVKNAAHRVFTAYLQQQRSTPALLAAVLKGGDAESRVDAAWHLGFPRAAPNGAGFSPDDREVIDALYGALESDDVRLRIYAARALAAGEGDTRARGLSALRQNIPNAEPIIAVRGARVLWLADRDPSEVTAVYERGLQDPGKWNRVETVSAILEMGKEADAFRSHFEHLKSDPDPDVRDRAEKAISWLDARR